jgi:hypothetical protein
MMTLIKIPRKTNKADETSPDKNSLDDEPTSRIDPSEPIRPVVTIPNEDSQDKETKTEPKRNQASGLQLAKRTLNQKRFMNG